MTLELACELAVSLGFLATAAVILLHSRNLRLLAHELNDICDRCWREHARLGDNVRHGETARHVGPGARRHTE